ncbi:MAG: hypothetical protein ACM3PZ_00595 [Bacillota bacterium]
MQKTIFQILILAAFLFLASFSAVWFDEESGREENAWAAKTAGGASLFMDALVRFSSPSSNSFSTGIRLEADQAAERLEDIAQETQEGVDYAVGSVGGSEGLQLPPALGSPETGFKSFLRDVLSGAPSRYLDIRLYNRGLKDFFSFYWLGLTGRE